MTKQEFARRAMEIVEICIKKDIEFEFNISKSRSQRCMITVFNVYNDSYRPTYLEWDTPDTDLTEMKKLVEEYEG